MNLQTVKKLAASIDKLKADLSTSATETGSQVSRSKFTGSTKLVRTQPVVTTSEVTPTVTSSTVDSSRTDDKPSDTVSSLDQVTCQLHALVDIWR